MYKVEYRLLESVTDDQTYCFAKPIPQAAYVAAYQMIKGESAAADYPANQLSVDLKLDDDWPGIKLPSFIGNAGNLVILHKDVAEFIKKNFSVEPVEIFAFTLRNQKGRVHSKDYVFFHPVGSRDCLDLDRSGVERRSDGSISDVEPLILDRRKLAGAPDMFRVRELPRDILVSGKLIAALEAQHFTNFKFVDVAVNSR